MTDLASPPLPGRSPPGGHAPGGRGLVPGLGTPHPLAERLPSALQEDDLCRRLVAALDDVLAPALSSLDCLDSYLDASLAPEDFVEWLSGWVGLDVDETWPADRRRQLVDNAVDLYRVRGTVAGLVRHVALYTGSEPEVEESGGCTWSATPGALLPGHPRPRLVVRVLSSEAAVAPEVVRRIVEASRPAHVPFVVEVES